MIKQPNDDLRRFRGGMDGIHSEEEEEGGGGGGGVSITAN